MRRSLTHITLAALLVLLSPLSIAGIMNYYIEFPTSGSPNPAMISLTLDFDFTTTVVDSTDGLTVQALNFAVDLPGVGFNYDSINDVMEFGGLVSTVNVIDPSTNDFTVFIADASTNPVAQSAQLAQGAGFIANALGDEVTMVVTNVPTPATAALLGIGLAGLGWSRRKRA